MGGAGERRGLIVAAAQQKRARCLHQDLLGLGARAKDVGEDGGGGDLIEVEGGVGGEGEAPFHPMEKVPQTYVQNH